MCPRTSERRAREFCAEVKNGQITTIEDIYLHSLPIKEYQIVDILFPAQQLKDDVRLVVKLPVQMPLPSFLFFLFLFLIRD